MTRRGFIDDRRPSRHHPNMTIEQPPLPAAGTGPPPRIATDELLLRRWRPGDLVQRYEAITISFGHLHPWMDWLAEPMSLDDLRVHSELNDASWPAPNGSYNYGIFAADGSVLGAIALHDLEPATWEIGYWSHIAHTGRGVITRSAAALTRIALGLPGTGRVEIHCDAANVRSAAVPRRLGYRLDRIEPRKVCAPAESGRGMFWIKDTGFEDRSAGPGSKV